jgi:hypothetical protein
MIGIQEIQSPNTNFRNSDVGNQILYKACNLKHVFPTIPDGHVH